LRRPFSFGFFPLLPLILSHPPRRWNSEQKAPAFSNFCSCPPLLGILRFSCVPPILWTSMKPLILYISPSFSRFCFPALLPFWPLSVPSFPVGLTKEIHPVFIVARSCSYKESTAQGPRSFLEAPPPNVPPPSSSNPRRREVSRS